MTNRKISAARTRERLVEAAKEIICAKGLSNTSVDEITEKSGVSKGTFYTYFKRKEDIVFELSKGMFSEILENAKSYGDDFIAKPFDMDVLMAKITALMRRTYDFQEPLGMMEHKGAMLNMGDATLTYQEKRMELTKNEFRILAKLMEHKGTTVSRDTLMLALWETDSFVDDNTLSVNVNRLRRKLADIGLRDFIVTKKGEGYRVE